MTVDDSRRDAGDLWRAQEGENAMFTSNEIRKRAQKLEREQRVLYWSGWVLLPLLVLIYARSLLRVRDPLLVAGLGFGLLTLLMVEWTLLRNRPARVSPARPCVDFVRQVLRAKLRGAAWIRRSLLLGVAAVVCCWAARPHASAAPFVAALGGLAFCWFSFWHQGRRMKRELDALER